MQDKKKFYINGKWIDPVKERDCFVINPSTEENCAVISNIIKHNNITLRNSLYKS